MSRKAFYKNLLNPISFFLPYRDYGSRKVFRNGSQTAVELSIFAGAAADIERGLPAIGGIVPNTLFQFEDSTANLFSI